MSSASYGPRPHGVDDTLGRVYTPPSFADAVVAAVTTTGSCSQSLDEQAGRYLRILDPSCGEGALLDAAGRRWPAAKLYGIDIDPQLERPVAVSHGHFMRGDWPTIARHWARMPLANHEPSLIVANPPFGDDVGIMTTIEHVRCVVDFVELRGCSSAMVILPLPYVCASLFEEHVWADHAPAILWRVTDRPWPDRLREVCCLEWHNGHTGDTRVRRLEWGGLTPEERAG